MHGGSETLVGGSSTVADGMPPSGGGAPLIMSDGTRLDPAQNIFWSTGGVPTGDLLPHGIDPRTILRSKLADVNGDGHEDLLVVTTSGGWVISGDGTAAGFHTATPIGDNSDTLTDVDVVDYNKDGTLDVLVVVDEGKPKVLKRTLAILFGASSRGTDTLLCFEQVYLGDPTRPGDFSLTRHVEIPLPEDLTSPRIAINHENGDVYISNFAVGGKDYALHSDNYGTPIAILGSEAYRSTGVAYGPGVPSDPNTQAVVWSSADNGYYYAKKTDGTAVRPAVDLALTHVSHTWDARDVVFSEDPSGGGMFVFAVNNDPTYLAYYAPSHGTDPWSGLGSGTGPKSEITGVEMSADGRTAYLKTDGGQIVVMTYNTGSSSWIVDSPSYLSIGNSNQALSSEAEDSDGVGLVAELRGPGSWSVLSGPNLVHDDGSGSFTQQKHRWWTHGPLPKSVVTADVDGDSDLDIIAVPSDSSNVKVFLNPGNGMFDEVTPVDLTAWTGATVDELVAHTDPTIRTLHAWKHGGATRQELTFGETFDPTKAPTTITHADVEQVVYVALERLGVLDDLAVVSSTGGVELVFNGATQTLTGFTGQPKMVTTGDLNSDVWPDLIVGTTRGIYAVLYNPSDAANPWSGSIVTLDSWAEGERDISALQASDLDGNGTLTPHRYLHSPPPLTPTITSRTGYHDVFVAYSEGTGSFNDKRRGVYMVYHNSVLAGGLTFTPLVPNDGSETGANVGFATMIDVTADGAFEQVYCIYGVPCRVSLGGLLTRTDTGDVASGMQSWLSSNLKYDLVTGNGVVMTGDPDYPFTSTTGAVESPTMHSDTHQPPCFAYAAQPIPTLLPRV